MRGTWVLAVLAAGAVACGGGNGNGNGNGNDKVTATGQAATTQAATTPPTTAAAAAPEPVAEGPACAEMAAKVIAVIAAERSERLRAEAPAMTEAVRQRCEEDKWSAGSRRCMAGAANRAEAKRCFEQLTPAQQESMDRAEAELRRARRSDDTESTGAAPPPPPPAPVTAPVPAAAERAKAPAKDAARKGKRAPGQPSSLTTDPDEGGEGK